MVLSILVTRFYCTPRNNAILTIHVNANGGRHRHRSVVVRSGAGQLEADVLPPETLDHYRAPYLVVVDAESLVVDVLVVTVPGDGGRRFTYGTPGKFTFLISVLQVHSQTKSTSNVFCYLPFYFIFFHFLFLT